MLSGFFGLGGGADRTRCQAEDCGNYFFSFSRGTPLLRRAAQHPTAKENMMAGEHGARTSAFQLEDFLNGVYFYPAMTARGEYAMVGGNIAVRAGK